MAPVYSRTVSWSDLAAHWLNLGTNHHSLERGCTGRSYVTAIRIDMTIGFASAHNNDDLRLLVFMQQDAYLE